MKNYIIVEKISDGERPIVNKFGYISQYPNVEMADIDRIYLQPDYDNKLEVKAVNIMEKQDSAIEFIENVYEIAFGDDAINRNFTPEEVLAQLRLFSDNALKWENQNESI